MSEKCLICDNVVEMDLCKVGSKGISGIIKASALRKDGKETCLRNKMSGVVHNTCRRQYVRSDSIKRFLREQALSEQPSTSRGVSSLRSGQSQFDFKTKCFFCTEEHDEEAERKKPYSKRRTIIKVRTTTFHNSVLLRGQERNDEWGNDVVRRICTVGDLHAVDAIYHVDCYKKFTLATLPSKRKAGRPIDEGISEAMNEIYDYIEKNDNCQFSMDDLLGQITGEPPTVKTIKARMKEKYGDQIVFSTTRTKQTVVCFHATGEKILNDAWYTSRCTNEQAENERIVRKAAEIILKDIESMAYDNSAYFPLTSFCREAEELIPQTLAVFTDCLAKKKRSQETVKKKMTTIAHTLIAAIRPRCFISPILSSIALLIYRKYGSKNLVDLLSKLGLSASYYEAQRLELSTIHHTEEPIPIGTFIQFVFDNADFNVSTLDGRNTFHSMGGIKCITPANTLHASTNVKRLNSAPPQEEVGQLGVLEVHTLEGRGTNALQQMIIEDLSFLKPIPSDIFTPTIQDLLWMSGKWLQEVEPTLEVPNIPEWKGFMQLTSKLINKETTSVTFLPFINSPPNEYSTIRTALQYALKKSQEVGVTVCFVTFDQPLYLKAREISFGSIMVRLGGFHLLMSFLGCIGHTMAGSGLKDVLCQIFAPNSVDKMLTGHAYSRAVRGHLLVQLVLAHIILDGANVSEEEKKDISTMLINMEEFTPDKVKENASLMSTLKKFQYHLETLKENGPTAALWVQYFNMVTLMKKYINFERCGDWDGHLACVQQIIPFFHASGHFQYAKCAHIYVQDMMQLKNSHPQTYKEFAEKGFFTINRTGTPWAGVWSDMVIEQTLMRSMKSSGGLTRGRGITDSVLAKWVCGSPGCTAICTSLEEFAEVVFASGEQHVDFRQSRQQRDSRDRAKIREWFSEHPPFPKLNSLISLSTGVLGNSKVNCHQALDIGTKTMQNFIGRRFSDMKQSKKNVVLSLASMSSSIKINGETVTVNPLTIFQRTVIAKKNDEDVADLLTYELTPFPMSLFHEGVMRKGKKSSLYDVLPVENNAALDLNQTTNVVDGGFLLHRMKWKPSSSVSSICHQYITYVQKHYGTNCMVVFDGYSDVNSTKRAEQKRRGLTRTSVDINCNENTIITVQQEHFLANENNKTRLIQFLTEKMTAAGIETTVATGDADGTIVSCGLDKAAVHPTVVIVGEDVDLIVLLMGLAPPNINVFFMKPGRGKVETKLFSVRQLQQLEFAKSILLLHSFSGCDTTSAIHGKSKVGIAKLFTAKPDLTQNISDIFSGLSTSPESIEQAGEKLFLAIYQAPVQEQNLNKYRYSAFLRASMKPKSDLATLPPTRGASKQHSLRVYLQIQQWLGNPLPPTQWGWARGDDGILKPVTTNDPVAPESILNTIFCRCTTGCGVRCGCRKAGIACSRVCGVCSGSCTNGAPIENTVDDDVDDDILYLEDN
ncbi:unnamed protein product [Parnassius mnemosyne]|uniref:Tesmin/TSO1-like CXC domain-containing protein n=1 Tax=Parnassius mnemosyne TaxID=213953 RepID=A0AAV1M0R7_9NEOP